MIDAGSDLTSRCSMKKTDDYDDVIVSGLSRRTVSAATSRTSATRGAVRKVRCAAIAATGAR